MYKKSGVFILLLGILSACTLGADANSTNPPDGTSVSTPFSTVSVTHTSLPSVTPDAAADLGILTATPDDPTTETDSAGRYEGNLIIQPIIYLDEETNAIVLHAGETVTLWWSGAPLEELAEVEFSLTRTGDHTAESLGIDKDLTDEARIFWAVPADISGTITASARLPGQDHRWVASPAQAVYSRATNDMPIDTGQIIIEPLVRQDGGWMVVKAGETVTLTWEDAPRDVFSIDFLLAPTGTGSTYSVIGTDDNPTDGASIAWQIPGGFTGHLTARANMHNLSAAVLNKEVPIYAEE